MKLRRPVFGAEALITGGVRFRFWAPACDAVLIDVVEGPGAGVARAMQQAGGGWHEAVLAECGPGSRYVYRLPDGRAVPDPASRLNPLGVHGPSEVTDPRAYRWKHALWGGRPWHTAVLYELHIGSFTPEARFDSALRRLPHLVELGISAIELMPVAAFAGERGWGYDGVLPFAPHAAYGSPDELKHFVDAAHGLGLMVLLDVVYNHFGPDGNHLGAYCPEFFNPAHHTPWGAAINFDAPGSTEVRRFFIENALYWVEEFGFDGLRLDAVHAICDTSKPHIVADISQALDAGPRRERQVHLVLENDANTAAWLPSRVGAGAVATAQWNDDLHHAAHVVATRETDGYYEDYGAQPVAVLAQALAEGFVYQGQPSASRGGALRGEPSAHLPSPAFVGFLQNHDQIGNRAFGERLDALAPASRVEALLACLLLAPHIPLLFMGEEFAAGTPFPYFCEHAGELGEAVTRGRRAEFARFKAFDDESARARIPDPNAPATFEASKLHWEECESERGRQRLAFTKQLLRLRRQHLEPLLPAQRSGGRQRAMGDAFEVEWSMALGVCWTMRANFGDAPVEFARLAEQREVYRNASVESLGDGVRIARDGVHVVLHRGGAGR